MLVSLHDELLLLGEVRKNNNYKTVLLCCLRHLNPYQLFCVLQISYFGNGFLFTVSKNSGSFCSSCFSIKCSKIWFYLYIVRKFKAIVMVFDIISYYELHPSTIIQLKVLLALIESTYDLNVRCYCKTQSNTWFFQSSVRKIKRR